jgi:uncharacterized protein YjbI with pentapeptide repeats
MADESPIDQPATEAGKETPTIPAKDVERCQYEGCQRLSELGSYHCIFHMSAEEKDTLKVWGLCMDMFHKLVAEGEGDFRGFVLKDIELSGRTVEQPLDFSFSHILGQCNFSATRFKKKLKFTRTRFLGDVCFAKTLFASEVQFKGAVFGSTEQKGIVDFISAVFNRECFFTRCDFFSEPEFVRTRFSREATFNGARFHGEAHFSGSKFQSNAFFKSCHFKVADFNNVVFEDRCDFSPEVVTKEPLGVFELAHFERVFFEKGGSFDDCTIREGSFENASIQNVSFHRVNLDKVKFAGAQMEQAYLADAWWDVPEERSDWQKIKDLISVADPRFVIREELEADAVPVSKREEKLLALLKAERTYRRLKHSHTNEGDYTKSGEFYIHEMRMKRERYSLEKGTELRAWWKLFWNWFYNISCGYGERPKRVVFNALLVIVTFTLLYYAGEGIGKDGDESYDPSFRESFYFSVVTFTTLGYGDYYPKSGFQLFATAEAFIGAFTIALFVLVFGRQVMR